MQKNKLEQNRAFMRRLAFASMLVALQIVLSRLLGIQAKDFQESLGFTAVATASCILGPVWGGVVAVAADFLGATLFGTGPYFPLFAINEVLYALVFAFYFYKKEASAFTSALSVVTNTVFISIPLTPLWLSLYYRLLLPENVKPYFAIFSAKITSALIALPFKIAVIIPLAMIVFPKLKKMFKN